MHFLVIPKKPIPQLSKAEDSDEQVRCSTISPYPSPPTPTPAIYHKVPKLTTLITLRFSSVILSLILNYFLVAETCTIHLYMGHSKLIKFMNMWKHTHTVKPVLSGHQWDPRYCLLNRGVRLLQVRFTENKGRKIALY